MRKPFQDFYDTPAWRHTREAYYNKIGGWCELCLAKGEYNPCEIIHHKIHLTADNVNDPNISLNEDNLVGVCRNCHAKEHSKRNKRYKVDEMGRVTII